MLLVIFYADMNSSRLIKNLQYKVILTVMDWFMKCWFWFLQISKEEKETYGSSWFSYGTSIATNILENLQVTLNHA